MANNNERRELRDSERTISHSGQAYNKGRFSPKRPLFWLTMVAGIAAVAILAVVLIPLLSRNGSTPAGDDGQNQGPAVTTGQTNSGSEEGTDPTTPEQPEKTDELNQGITQPGEFAVMPNHLQTGGGAFKIVNDSQEELYYGLEFMIEQYASNGWQAIEPDEPMIVPAIAMIVEAGETVYFQANWEQYYGHLENGRHRLVKNSGSERPWYAEFEITDSTTEGSGLTPPPTSMHEDITRVDTNPGITLNFDPSTMELTIDNELDDRVMYGRYFVVLQPIKGLDNADPTDPESYHFIPMRGDAAFEDIGLMLDAGASNTETINLGLYYPGLPAGDYVLLRSFWGDGEYEGRITASAGFALEETLETPTAPGDTTTIDPDSSVSNGISFEAIPGTITPSGGQFRILNNTIETVMTGADWRLVIFDGDRWTEIKPIEEPFFIEIMYEIDADGVFEFEADWEPFYGVLEPGEYALAKDMFGQEDNPYVAMFNVGEVRETPMEEEPNAGSGVDPGASELAMFHVVEDTLTRTGGTFVINNTTDEELSFGADWYLVKSVTGGWELMEPLEEMSWIAILYSVEPGGSYEFEANWKDYYGVLEPGVYGLSKEVGGFVVNPFVATFEVTDDTP